MNICKKLLFGLMILIALFVSTESDAVFSPTSADIAGDTFRSNSAVPADFDGDGDLDIYVANTSGQQNRLWINDGTGSFTSNDIVGDLGNSQRPSVGDIDGDGDIDIYTINDASSDEQNRLWINDGTGSFTSNDISGDLGSSWDSAMFDMDGDGDLDIYVANHHLNQNKIWINDGTGSFTANDIVGDTKSSGHVIPFDADGDGDTDMYVGEAGQNKIWINDGTGSFTENDIVGDTTFTYGGNAADFDGDGDLDLYVTTWSEGQNKIWINDGTGSFTENDIVGDTNTSRDAFLEDLDLDGDIDIYTFIYGGQNKIWLNDGAANFSVGDPITGDDGLTFTGFFADLSGDGFVDLYSSNNGQNELWLLNLLPAIVITAPTKINNAAITDTTIQVVDEIGVLVVDVLVDAATTATTSSFSCVQTLATQVDCTISIDSSGDLVIAATDSEGSSGTVSELNYNIDTTPPNISVSIDTVTNDINHPIFTFSGTDDVAVDYFDVTYNTDNAGPGIGGATTDSPVTSPLTLTLDPDESLHTVTFTVYDTAGNSNNKILIFPPVVNFTTPTLISNGTITDAQVTISTPTGNDIDNIVLTPGTTGATLGPCVGAGGDVILPYAQPVLCGIDGVTNTGTLTVTAEDSVNGAVGQNDQMFTIDTTNPVLTITAPTKSLDGSITDTTIQVTDDYSILVADITVDAATTATISSFSCVQTTSTQVNCTIDIDSSGDLVIAATDEAGNSETESEDDYFIDNTAPVITITAPTKLDDSDSSITNTTIRVTDDDSILAVNVNIDPATTATTSSFSCVQTLATQVDCTISIDSSGDLVISASDDLGNFSEQTEPDYIITLVSSGDDSGSGGGTKFICEDPKALNYDDSGFGRHKASRCEYELKAPTEENPFGGEQCGVDLIITDNMKNGDTDGQYSSYNKGAVTQIHILQGHMNRLLRSEYGNQAAGPVDGIFRSLTKRGVERLQRKLNQLLPDMTPLVIDGIVGRYTKAALNMSC